MSVRNKQYSTILFRCFLFLVVAGCLILGRQMFSKSRKKLVQNTNEVRDHKSRPFESQDINNLNIENRKKVDTEQAFKMNFQKNSEASIEIEKLAPSSQQQNRKVASINQSKSQKLQSIVGTNVLPTESLDGLSKPEDIQSFLRSTQLNNPNDIRKAQAVPMDDQVLKMAGVYYGDLTWDKTPNHPIQLKVDYEPSMSNGLVRGQVNVELSLKGVVFDQRSFVPTLGGIQGSEGTPDATVLALGSNRYLQLYFVNNLQAWVGNFYMRNPVTSNLQYVGTTTLAKR